MTQKVLFSKHKVSDSHSLGVITLNTPESLNALKHEMVQAIDLQLKTWSTDDAICAIVFHASGEKAFCAGGNIKDLYHLLQSSPSTVDEFIRKEYSVDHEIFTYNKPTICLSTRLTMGAGMGLMQACSFRIVSPQTTLAMPEAKIGIFPDVGATYFYGNLADQLGLYLGLTSATLNASDALETGLATHGTSGRSDNEIISFIAQYNWESFTNDSLHNYLNELSNKELPESNIVKHKSHIDNILKGKTLTEISKAIQNDQSTDKWLQQNRENSCYSSPTSLELIFLQLTKGQGLDRKIVRDLEIGVMTELINKNEFAEGVRALLIDKDKTPQWQQIDQDAIKELNRRLTK